MQNNIVVDNLFSSNNHRKQELSIAVYISPTASGLFAVISEVGGGHIGPPPRNAPRGPQNGEFGKKCLYYVRIGVWVTFKS